MSGEKTEKPTQKKIRDARKKGQVANSKDVNSTALLIGMFSAMMVSWNGILLKLEQMMHLPIQLMNEPFHEAVETVITGIFKNSIGIVLPFIGTVMVIGIGSNYLQVGPLLALEGIKPDLKKLDPVNKLKQMFAVKNLVEFLKSSLKVIILGTIVTFLIKGYITPLMKLPHSGPYAVIEILGPMLKHFCIAVALVYAAVAAFDFFFQQNQHIEQLKMSKDEVKREYKEQEGSPEIKSKRKQLHQELLTQNTVETVKKSSAVVANPTRVCVAILYEQGRTPLPVVTAKGKNNLAKLMRKAAQEADVPVIENVWLARNLYVDVEENNFIPREYITPVVEVLKEVQRLKKQQGAASST